MPWVCHIVRESCTGCGICADVCLHGALRMGRAAAFPEGVDGACVGCMDCERECPFDAMHDLLSCYGYVMCASIGKGNAGHVPYWISLSILRKGESNFPR